MTSLNTDLGDLLREPVDFGRTDILAPAMAHRWNKADRLDEICGHALLPPGKLFRPHLLIESGIAVGGTLSHLLPAAVGTEFGHVASLIHDDIIDQDELRRGRPSVSARYGLESAILSGDALFFSLFGCLAECHAAGAPARRVVRALEVISAVGIELCRGQFLEAEISADLHCGRERYLRVITLKTAALFRGACACGAILGGGSQQQIEALQRYGDNLGIAFQLRDDLLPYTSDTAHTGKSSASDAKNKRVTLPVIVAYECGDAAVRSEIERIFTAHAPDAGDYEALRALVADTDAVTEVMSAAGDHVRTALQALDTLPDTPSRDRLERYAELALTRSA